MVKLMIWNGIAPIMTSLYCSVSNLKGGITNLSERMSDCIARKTYVCDYVSMSLNKLISIKAFIFGMGTHISMC